MEWRAGYSAKSASSIANEMMQKPHIRAKLQELEAAADGAAARHLRSGDRKIGHDDARPAPLGRPWEPAGERNSWGFPALVVAEAAEKRG
jgi:hypothetical protein